MRPISPIVGVASAFLFCGGAAFATQRAIVTVPVADLRCDQSLPVAGQSDDKQQTQLLQGESVEVVRSSGNWVYVRALQQPEFTTHQKWEGYPGCDSRGTYPNPHRDRSQKNSPGY